MRRRRKRGSEGDGEETRGGLCEKEQEIEGRRTKGNWRRSGRKRRKWRRWCWASVLSFISTVTIHNGAMSALKHSPMTTTTSASDL